MFEDSKLQWLSTIMKNVLSFKDWNILYIFTQHTQVILYMCVDWIYRVCIGLTEYVVETVYLEGE
jgi:hypothetical protein